MKGKTKVVALLVALCLMGSLAACGSQPAGETTPMASPVPTGTDPGKDTDSREMDGNTYKEGLPIVKDKETVRVVIARNELDKSKSFSEKDLVKQLEEETNIHIEWTELAPGSQKEKIPLLLASDLPDVFLNGCVSKSNFSKNLESFASLEDLAKEWCPNTVKDYEEGAQIIGEDLWDLLRQSDGNIYSLWGGSLANELSQVDGVPVINQKWLTNLNLQMPKTLDDYYNVLKAFKEQDANGDGDPGNEIPLGFCNVHWAGEFTNFASNWGFVGYYKVKDGKVVSTMDTKQCREWLEFYHKLASEGILDVEGFSQTQEQFTSKFKQKIIGATYCWSPTEFANSDEDALEYTFLPPFSVPNYDGQTFYKGRKNRLSASSTALVITKECKNVPAVLRWWDYIARSPESKFEYCNGPLRTDSQFGIFEKGEDGTFYSVYDGDWTADFSRENFAYTNQIANSSPLILQDLHMTEELKEENPAGYMRAYLCEETNEYLPTEGLPYRSIPADNNTEFALKTSDLVTYLESFIANSVVNGITDSTWEEHLNQMKALNYDYYIQFYQDFLDGKF